MQLVTGKFPLMFTMKVDRRHSGVEPVPSVVGDRYVVTGSIFGKWDSGEAKRRKREEQAPRNGTSCDQQAQLWPRNCFLRTRKYWLLRLDLSDVGHMKINTNVNKQRCQRIK